MSVPVTINGQVFNIPETGDRGWGIETTALLNALATGLLQRSGGSFTLTNDVDFGTNYGLLVKWLKSKALDPASDGFLRLSTGDVVAWRNSTNTGDVKLETFRDTDFNYEGIKHDSKELINEDSQQYLRNKIFGDKDLTPIDASAVFEARSTTQGSAPYPRMTKTQRDAIANPLNGLVVYNLTNDSVDHFNGTSWVSLGTIEDTVDWDNPSIKVGASQNAISLELLDRTKQTLGNSTKNFMSQDAITREIGAVSSLSGSSILTELQKYQKNTPDRTWTTTTINLNAGISQVNNLTISGSVNVRATNTASTAILEILGDLTLEPGAILTSYRVMLYVRGRIIGDASNRGIITTFAGAAGGAGGASVGVAGGAGAGAVIELGGAGGAGGANGGGVYAAGAGGGGGGGGYYVGVGGGGGGGGAGIGGAGSYVSTGGAAGGGSSYVGAGGAGGGGVYAGGGGGGGGGGSGLSIITLSSVENIILSTGVGGVGGVGANGGANGNGGQSGPMYAYLRPTQITNVTFDVRAGTSMGDIRDGTAGNLRLYDLDTGNHSFADNVSTTKNIGDLSWTYSNANDILTRLVGVITSEGYFTKSSTGV